MNACDQFAGFGVSGDDGLGLERVLANVEAQIAFALQQAETGTPVAEVCRKIGISENTFHRWKKKYAGMLPSDL